MDLCRTSAGRDMDMSPKAATPPSPTTAEMGDIGGGGGTNWISSALSSEWDVEGPSAPPRDPRLDLGPLGCCWCSMAARMKAAALAALDFPLALLRVLISPTAAAFLAAADEEDLVDLTLPSEAALAALTLFTPHALHRVFGPRGPSLHCGVLVTPHCEQDLPAVEAAIIFALYAPSSGEKGLGGFRDLFRVGFCCCCCCCCYTQLYMSFLRHWRVFFILSLFLSLA
mmetsp:Transcript_13318/g.37390  ORF Transcript_13318/g.37390 Transcript_13318/m.37390 type:complete len:227 (+) Transcript_13318:1379-2059(+)